MVIFSIIPVLGSGLVALAGVVRLMYVLVFEGVFGFCFFFCVGAWFRRAGMMFLLVGGIALLGIRLELVMFLALLRFGFLVVLTLVDVWVVSAFCVFSARSCALRARFFSLFVGVCGAVPVGALWVVLVLISVVLGLIWSGVCVFSVVCFGKWLCFWVPSCGYVSLSSFFMLRGF
ncbi:hypothetical protein [Escherichia coli]|uniref:hypothetical protein n=1 Tax=Escherichia coli TaxID=562 RepID=UPI00065824C9|nr:hypothetical protein [Escherichia coli]KLX63933.1 hypothetical protein SK79_01216 [Escherichia coli]